MFTVIHHSLPIEEGVLRDELTILFATSMASDPIYSYWIPHAKREMVLRKMFLGRLSSHKVEDYAVISDDCLCAAIISQITQSRVSWIQVIWSYGKYIPVSHFTSWWRLVAVAYGLRKNKVGNKMLYLEAVVTSQKARRSGYASRILESIEEKANAMSYPVICETHNGELMSILAARGWQEISLSMTLMKRLGIRFMLYSNQ